MTSASDAVAQAHRSDWARIVSGLIRLTRDWALAEDATSDAFATALVRWEADGVPANPPAWLATTARYLPAARADLLERSGRTDDAVRYYEEALTQTQSRVEREQLVRRLRSLT
jgi:RNA polymerase sigma-70 factor (ECF subfamily)